MTYFKPQRLYGYRLWTASEITLGKSQISLTQSEDNLLKAKHLPRE